MYRTLHVTDASESDSWAVPLVFLEDFSAVAFEAAFVAGHVLIFEQMATSRQLVHRFGKPER
jgi:hypothetical protein